MIINIARYIKNISIHLKNYGKHLSEKQIDQYGLDYLLNEDNKKHIDAFEDARDLLNERILYLKKETKSEKNS